MLQFCYNFVTILVNNSIYATHLRRDVHGYDGLISCWLRTEAMELFPVGGGEGIEDEAEGLVIRFEFGDAFVFLFEEGLHWHGDIGGAYIDGAACYGAFHLVMVEDFRVVGGFCHSSFTEYEPVSIYIMEHV